jgi:hypothetical protein
MKLVEKIKDREIAYLFRRQDALAFELAILYFILAKRKNCRLKIAAACATSLRWLKQSRVFIPIYVSQLSCFGQLEEIEKLLVANKAKIDDFQSYYIKGEIYSRT